MNDEQLSLWRKIEQYELDREGASFPFSARLAKEAGWTARYTQRAIHEYKRFIFLGMVAGHPVSPSEEVDEVWHLHLTYSEDYWKRFCNETLQKPFHHHPTQGGPTERAKFDDWYSKTLDSYRRIFQEDPPADIWPVGLTKRPAVIKVDQGSHWVIRKPAIRLQRKHALFLLLPALIAAGCTTAYANDPLDFRGPDFLLFYIEMYAACLVAAALAKYFLTGPSAPSTPTPYELDLDEIAYLNGGEQAVIQSATAYLIAEKAVEVNPDIKKLELLDPNFQAKTPVQQRILRWLNHTGPQKVRIRPSEFQEELDAIQDSLRAKEMLLSRDRALAVVLITFGLSMLAPLYGVAKINVGLTRERPVAFLIVLCLFSLIINCAAFLRKNMKSRLGTAQLTKLKSEHSNCRKVSGDDSTGEDYALGVALFGIVAIQGSPLNDYAVIVAPSSSGGDSGGCSGGGGGSCGGGGGCGGCGG